MLFSIIIPIYNVSVFIKRGFDSLLAQGFRDYEVIFVDDGSTDDSNAICMGLVNRYPNVSLYRQKNSGPGPSRNLGIEKAKGEYLMFFDIDDILLPDALQKIADKINSDRFLQVIMFGYREIDSTTGYSTEFAFLPYEYHSNDEIRKYYIDRYLGLDVNNGFVWNKVYQKQFIKNNNITFRPLRIQQDEVFNLSVYPCLTRLSVLDDVLYNYYVYHSGNASSNYFTERVDVYRQVREAFFTLYNVWGLQDVRFENYVNRRYIRSMISHVNNGLFGHTNKQSISERNIQLRQIFEIDTIRECIKKMPDGLSRNYMFYCTMIKLRSVWGYNLLLLIDHIADMFKSTVKRIVR